MRRFLTMTTLALVIGLAVVWSQREALILLGIEAVAERTMAAPLVHEREDGLYVLLCGAGNPLPDPKRSGPCTAILAGDTIVIIDAGGSAARNLAMLGVPANYVDAVLITHFHSDHIDGLGELMLQRWAAGEQDAPLPVHGPTGVDELVDGFNAAYRRDTALRIAHHGEAMLDSDASGGQAQPFATPDAGEMVPVLQSNGLVIRSFRVDHGPVKPAVGYRIDYKGRSVVVSGDTARSSNLEAMNPDIDLLVHEAQNAEMVKAVGRAADKAGQPRFARIAEDILHYHTTPVEAAQSASATNAKHLLFTHVAPALPFSFMNAVFAQGVSNVYDGPYTVGEDGTLAFLPAGSADIHLSQVSPMM